MACVSAERIFLSHFPRARLETQRQQFGRPYYLVRLPGAQMWSGCGDTRAQAWRDACDRYGLTSIFNGTCPAGKHGLDFPGQDCDLCAADRQKGNQ